jgi:LPS sulfotransferase NodH
VTEDEPVFVVGFPRSGTTLISEVLSAHPDLVVSPETFYFLRFAPRCEAAGGLSDREARRSFLEHFTSFHGVGDMELGEATIEAYVDELVEPAEVGHDDILGGLLRRFADQHDASRWGEKTPAHLRKVPEILEAFPEARILCVVRDPRDAILSQFEADMGDRGLVHRARRWSRFAGLEQQWSQTYPERFARVRYEDLLVDTQPVVEAICEHVGLPFEPSMLAHHDTDPQSFDPGREPKKAKAARPIDPSNREKWREAMDDRDVRVVELFCAEAMDRYGYPRGEVRLTPGALAKAGGELVKDLALTNANRVRWWANHYLTAPDLSDA